MEGEGVVARGKGRGRRNQVSHVFIGAGIRLGTYRLLTYSIAASILGTVTMGRTGPKISLRTPPKKMEMVSFCCAHLRAREKKGLLLHQGIAERHVLN